MVKRGSTATSLTHFGVCIHRPPIILSLFAAAATSIALSGTTMLPANGQTYYEYPSMEQVYPQELLTDPTILPNGTQQLVSAPLPYPPLPYPPSTSTITQNYTMPEAIPSHQPSAALSTTIQQPPSPSPSTTTLPTSSGPPQSTIYPPSMQMPYSDPMNNLGSGSFSSPSGFSLSVDCVASGDECQDEDDDFEMEDFPIDMSPSNIN